LTDEFDDLNWRKSSRSNYSGCVEVRFSSGGVAVRNSRTPSGAVLEFTFLEWSAFLEGAALGEFDPPLSTGSPAS
jgi:hypothetical protein